MTCDRAGGAIPSPVTGGFYMEHEHLEFKCSDIGMKCDWKVRAHTEGELMERISKHAAEVHGITNPDAETLTKIQGAIRTGREC